MRKKISSSRLGATTASSSEPTPRSSPNRRSALGADRRVPTLLDVVGLVLDDVVDDGTDDRGDDHRDRRDNRPLERGRTSVAPGGVQLADAVAQLVPEDADKKEHRTLLPTSVR